MPKLVAPTPKPIILRPVRANAGLQAAYRKKLLALVDEMNNSILYWLSASYNQNLPDIAADASPVKAIQKTINNLKAQWLANFKKGAEKLAEWHTKAVLNHADPTLKTILKEAGFTVPMQMTDVMQTAYDAVVAENVGLITSLSQRSLDQIEVLVMQSVQTGRDLHTLTESLKAQFGMTEKRATLIARDQNNKATSVITRARQKDLGLNEAMWMHSHAGKVPRKSHVAANGKIYNIDKGMLIDGEYIFPSEKINCRCFAKVIIPGFID